MSETIKIFGSDSEIWKICIDRPECKNAVNGPTAKLLFEAFEKFDKDPNAKVAIFYGANNTFCSGADLKSFSSSDPSVFNRTDETGYGPMGPSRMILSKPVIVAIAGFAVAGGFELALWGDLRIIEEDAIMGVFCRRVGVPLIDGGTVRLPRLIGLSRALDLILTGRPVKADEALQMGLVNRIAKKGKSLEIAEEIAKQLIKFPQTCLREDRLSTYEQFGFADIKDALLNEFHHGMKTLNSGEYKQGAELFINGQGRHGQQLSRL